VTRIYIHGADNNVHHTGPNDRIRAGCCATNRGTGFQSNVERGASGHVGGKVAEALDLSMFMACSSMVAPCHNPIVNRKDRTDNRIGTRLSLCFFRFFQRRTHKPLISLCPHRHDKINSCALSFRQHHRESRPENYRRTFELDPSIDADKISAKIDQRVVT
jgi:hypothetical protein